MKVKISRENAEKLTGYARACLPEEACGLIAGYVSGEEKIIEKVYLLENTDHSAQHFSLSPKEQLAAVRDMRENGLRPLGNWHSHPDTPSRQSEEDIRLAYDRQASYLILSLENRDAPVLHSFHTENGISAPEELEIF